MDLKYQLTHDAVTAGLVVVVPGLFLAVVLIVGIAALVHHRQTRASEREAPTAAPWRPETTQEQA